MNILIIAMLSVLYFRLRSHFESCYFRCGIGGLSTAIALKQEGFDVSVYERHNTPTEIGAGIICWPNASFVLDQLDILDKVAKVSGSINHMNRFSSTGEPIGSLDINELSRLMTYSRYSIIHINYQHEVIELLNHNEGTVVKFRHGGSIEPDVITKIINGTLQSSSNKIYVHDHDPIDKWHKNNVVLLGDAAHSPLPTSGQGACQALEDAWHLAKCLKENINDISKAFKQFTELRKSKTANMTIVGRQLASSIFNQDVEFCQSRDLTSKNTDYKGVVLAMAKGWSSGLPITV